jgi:hypothetical protein
VELVQNIDIQNANPTPNAPRPCDRTPSNQCGCRSGTRAPPGLPQVAHGRTDGEAQNRKVNRWAQRSPGTASVCLMAFPRSRVRTAGRNSWRKEEE